MRLPVRAVRSRPDAVITPSRHTPRALAGTRILVVDDSADARDLITSLLDAHGAAVTTAASAPEALAALTAEPFDLMLADIGMPGQDGCSLIRAVRALSTTAGRIRAVAVTAYASGSERDDALDAGFDAHVSKPVDPQRLLTVVSALRQRDLKQSLH